MPASDFYAVDDLTKIAINLFHGWGYNFYKLENQLRADDRLIREKACSLLGEARASIEAAEAAYRRDTIPAPSRAKPFPDAAVIAEAAALEALSRSIGALEGQIRAQPAPESDRMSELFRRERDILVQLGNCDYRLIGQAELLRTKLVRANAATIAAMRRDLDDGLHAIAPDLARAPRDLRQSGVIGCFAGGSNQAVTR